MATVRVKWLEKLQFVGIDATKHSVVMSGQGKKDGIGMSPSQLLLVALGGCTAYDVVNILTKKRQRLTGLEIEIAGEQEPDPPWTYRKIHLSYRLRGRGLSDKAVQDAIELSKNKYCSVGATLEAAAKITYDYVIEEE
ncbi:MAG TPA: OsmC family peroxiredoxin [Anaerolineales bacterium]|nr:OsmC family peroxiredoxin [Anaerolineae bacterium]HIQ01649.1 OsmC family peroxiredoxin [Anaerolineales bacterium]